MIGMQAARLRAESQGRKAKVRSIRVSTMLSAIPCGVVELELTSCVIAC